jgi:hypothetical protein
MRGEKMEVQYDKENDEYYIKEHIDNQTVKLVFQMNNWNEDTIFFNVYLTLYNKRNQINSNETEAKITGANPMKSFFVVRKAFRYLVWKVLDEYNWKYDLIIYCTWLDNRRRDAYYKYLSSLGYRYGRIDGEKCIFKRYKKGTENYG